MVGKRLLTRCFVEWELDTKHRAAPDLVLGPYRATMHLDDRTRNGQPHAHATFLGREKRLEYVFQLVRWNARAEIGYRDLGPRIVQKRCAPDNLAPSAQGVRHHLHCVGDQIQDDLLKLNPIGAHSQWLRSRSVAQRDIACEGLRRKKFKRFANRFIEL